MSDLSSLTDSSAELTRSKLSEIEVSKEASPETEVSAPSETKVSISTESHISNSPTPTKSRPPITELPDDPKEKQKHVIKMALERFPVLSLKYSTGNTDYFDCSIICPLCNNNHKKENIKNCIEGLWGSGDYVNTRTYRLRCWGNKYQNSIQIVTVKA
ncbi:hypothetical protein Glove_131g96 [Diversispora epigaea]|uniref:Uncharacterized protein n=1 Tax=Diversispora epigaea TaxID=1348612 RepID=A0A397J7U6_9GLOM|nr:hypothetical protein Glove_131g96 [Diversispora epigaea]